MPTLKYPIVNGRKQCSDCREWKSVSEFQKARKHLKTNCKSCVKIWAKNYRQRPEVKKSQLLYSQKYRRVPKNRKILNERTRIWRKKPSSKVKRNAARRAWAAREKQRAVEYKGGKCECCGYFGCLAAMDFHHKNPKEKEGYGTGALKAHWTFERNKKEIDKCVLLCVRCHREIHAGFRIL